MHAFVYLQILKVIEKDLFLVKFKLIESWLSIEEKWNFVLFENNI